MKGVAPIGTIKAGTKAALITAIQGIEQQKIQASDKEADDLFGYSVSISADGSTAIVGALYEDTGGSQAGAAYIFTRWIYMDTTTKDTS